MSSAPNQLPRSSNSASSSHSQTEAQTDSALEPSSPAETMTDQTANSVLMSPPTRMTSPGSTESEETSPTTTSPVAPKAPASPVAGAESSTAPSAPPTPTPSDAAPEPATSAPEPAPAAKAIPRNQPIPPASEPMQYRAIGLVRGKYEPSEEQFTRGAILTEDGVQIDAVLLGRVMSLVKKHIDLAEPHLWVVYPRTRDKELDLHMQIVGVWEPDKLNRSISDDEEEASETEAEESSDVATATDDDSEVVSEQPTDAELPAPEDLDDRYFSVRGEVVFQSEEDERLLIKIRRSPKQGSTQAKAFKVALKGTLAGKGVGYFWDFQVQREQNDLVVKEATQIGMVPPQKRQGGSGGPRRGPGGRPPGGPRRGPGGPGGPSGPPRKRWQDREGGSAPSGRPSYRDRGERSGGGDRPAPAPRQPIEKPIKRRPPAEES